MRQTASSGFAGCSEGARMENEQEQQRKTAASHRASYILEFGTWKATCKTCGWTVRDPQRRQAASRFRLHIRDARLIDLTDPVGLEAGLAAMGLDPGVDPETEAVGERRVARYAPPETALWELDAAPESPASRRMRLTN